VINKLNDQVIRENPASKVSYLLDQQKRKKNFFPFFFNLREERYALCVCVWQVRGQ
jgi:hypothetical protein